MAQHGRPLARGAGAVTRLWFAPGPPFLASCSHAPCRVVDLSGERSRDILTTYDLGL